MNNEQFLNERIQVIAVFGTGHQPCHPVRFKRANGREIEVTELGLHHPSGSGRRMVHILDVTDGEADYRLELDAERLTWRLSMEADHYED
jgi:hypothetical protein